MTYALSASGWATVLAKAVTENRNTTRAVSSTPHTQTRAPSRTLSSAGSGSDAVASDPQGGGARTPWPQEAAALLSSQLPGELPPGPDAVAATGAAAPGDAAAWSASRGQPPAAWFEAASGPLALSLFKTLLADLQRQQRRTAAGIDRAHARLQAVRRARVGPDGGSSGPPPLPRRAALLWQGRAACAAWG